MTGHRPCDVTNRQTDFVAPNVSSLNMVARLPKTRWLPNGNPQQELRMSHASRHRLLTINYSATEAKQEMARNAEILIKNRNVYNIDHYELFIN